MYGYIYDNQRRTSFVIPTTQVNCPDSSMWNKAKTLPINYYVSPLQRNGNAKIYIKSEFGNVL